MSDTKPCYYCKKDFPADDLRPYAPGGEYTCFPCGMLPENRDKTDQMIDSMLDTVMAGAGDGIILLTTEGPMPNVEGLSSEVKAVIRMPTDTD